MEKQITKEIIINKLGILGKEVERMAQKKEVHYAKRNEYFSNWSGRYFFINLYLDNFKKEFTPKEYERVINRLHQVRDEMVDFVIFGR